MRTDKGGGEVAFGFSSRVVVLVEAVAQVVVSAPGFSSVSISDNGLAMIGTELDICAAAAAPAPVGAEAEA